jgi:hypothetical protein
MAENATPTAFTKRQKASCLLGILSLLIVQPIWYWLVYQILVRVEATQLMWFLYCIYVPAGLAISILFKISDTLFDDKK